MIISFHTEEIRDQCCDINISQKAFGDYVANNLITIIAEIEAFDNAHEALDFIENNITINDNEEVSFEFSPNYFITFVAVDKKFARNNQNDIDWSTVKRMKLLGVSKR